LHRCLLVNRWSISAPKVKKAPASKTKEGSTRKKDEMGDYTPFKKGGTVSSASKRGDGIAMRGKTRGRMV
jgi:hypothetical protein